MSCAAVACGQRKGSAAGWAEYEKACPDRREADDDHKAAGRGGDGRCQAGAAPGEAVAAELEACGGEHSLYERAVWEVLFAGQGPAEGEAVGERAGIGGRLGPRVGGEQPGEVCA